MLKLVGAEQPLPVGHATLWHVMPLSCRTCRQQVQRGTWCGYLGSQGVCQTSIQWMGPLRVSMPQTTASSSCQTRRCPPNGHDTAFLYRSCSPLDIVPAGSLCTEEHPGAMQRTPRPIHQANKRHTRKPSPSLEANRAGFFTS
jgi:hypothetical protein